MGPRSRPHSSALHTGRRRCPERGGPGISENYLQRDWPGFLQWPEVGSPCLQPPNRLPETETLPRASETLGRLWGNADPPKHSLWRRLWLGASLGLCGSLRPLQIFPDTSGFGDYREKGNAFKLSGAVFHLQGTLSKAWGVLLPETVFSFKQMQVILFHFRSRRCVQRPNPGSV